MTYNLPCNIYVISRETERERDRGGGEGGCTLQYRQSPVHQQRFNQSVIEDRTSYQQVALQTFISQKLNFSTIKHKTLRLSTYPYQMLLLSYIIIYMYIVYTLEITEANIIHIFGSNSIVMVKCL